MKSSLLSMMNEVSGDDVTMCATCSTPMVPTSITKASNNTYEEDQWHPIRHPRLDRQPWNSISTLCDIIPSL